MSSTCCAHMVLLSHWAYGIDGRINSVIFSWWTWQTYTLYLRLLGMLSPLNDELCSERKMKIIKFSFAFVESHVAFWGKIWGLWSGLAFNFKEIFKFSFSENDCWNVSARLLHHNGWFLHLCDATWFGAHFEEHCWKFCFVLYIASMCFVNVFLCSHYSSFFCSGLELIISIWFSGLYRSSLIASISTSYKADIPSSPRNTN